LAQFELALRRVRQRRQRQREQAVLQAVEGEAEPAGDDQPAGTGIAGGVECPQYRPQHLGVPGGYPVRTALRIGVENALQVVDD
jgi:hypothetical protein